MTPTQSKMRPQTNLASSVPEWAFGGLTALMGLIVIAGWYSNNTTLVQILPSLVPMQFNTALGFLLCGAGLALIGGRFHRAALVAGGLAALIGALTIVEYLFQVNLGIDELFISHGVTVKTSHPGRMAPNTALCFVLAGTTLSSAAIELHSASRHFLLAIAASLVVALGAVSLAGYLGKMETAYGWGELTRMALHTAIGFIVLGGGILQHAWRQETMVASVGLRFSMLAFVFSVTVAIFMWRVLEANEQEKLNNLMTEAVGSAEVEINQSIRPQLLALQRMGRRWEREAIPEREPWEADARQYLSHIAGLESIEWVDVEGNRRWAVSTGGNLDAAQHDHPCQASKVSCVATHP